MSVGLMAHGSSIGNIRDLISFRLTTAGQTGGEVQAGKLACMDEHHYLAARGVSLGKGNKSYPSNPFNPFQSVLKEE